MDSYFLKKIPHTQSPSQTEVVRQMVRFFFLFKIFCSNFSAPLAGILADVSVSALPKSGNKLFGGDLPLETRFDFSQEAPNVV